MGPCWPTRFLDGHPLLVIARIMKFDCRHATNKLACRCRVTSKIKRCLMHNFEFCNLSKLTFKCPFH